jgi:hypothetical protein
LDPLPAGTVELAAPVVIGRESLRVSSTTPGAVEVAAWVVPGARVLWTTVASGTAVVVAFGIVVADGRVDVVAETVVGAAPSAASIRTARASI